jgi:hypothetical protein
LAVTSAMKSRLSPLLVERRLATFVGDLAARLAGLAPDLITSDFAPFLRGVVFNSKTPFGPRLDFQGIGLSTNFHTPKRVLPPVLACFDPCGQVLKFTVA